MSKLGKLGPAEAIKKFEAAAHKAPLLSSDKLSGAMWIYEKCRSCGVSFYYWSAAGFSTCPGAKDKRDVNDQFIG